MSRGAGDEGDAEPRRRSRGRDDDLGDRDASNEPRDVPAPGRRVKPAWAGDDDDEPRRAQDDDEPRRDDDEPRKPRKHKQKKGWNLSKEAVIWIMLIGIGVCVGAFFLIRHLARQSELGPFNKRIGEYTAAAAPGGTGTYVKGKVLPVDVSAPKVDSFYYDLPPDLQPQSPAEVGTVLLLQWGELKVGEYTGGAGAYVRTCKVTVVDHEKRAMVGSTEVRGGEPPSSVRRGNSGYGSYPYDQILSYVKGLPRR